MLLDHVELERLVVAPALEHLREEALDAPALAGQRRVKEDEPRLRDALRALSHSLLLLGRTGGGDRPSRTSSTHPRATRTAV